MTLNKFIIWPLLWCLQLCAVNAQNFQWGKSAGGASNDQAYSLALDGNGSIYEVGAFKSPTASFNQYTLNNSGNFDAYIAKYDSLGNVQWAKGSGGFNQDIGYSVAVDDKGNIYYCGAFWSPSILFGNITLMNPYSPSSDIFIAKYSPNGNVIWAKRFGGNNDDGAYSICCGGGSVFITGGYHSDTLVFDSDTAFNYDNTGSCDFFVAKMDTSGSIIWIKNTGSYRAEEGNSVSADNSGNVFVVGVFDSPFLGFESTVLTNTTPWPITWDIFVVKYDSNGALSWARQYGGMDSDWGSSISTDRIGHIFISGSFLSPTVTFGSTTLANSGVEDAFVIRMDTAGTVNWAKNYGGLGADYCNSIFAVDSSKIYATGSFSGTVSFDSYNMNSLGGEDVFIAKLNSSGVMQWVRDGAGNQDDQGIAIVADNFDNVYASGNFKSNTLDFGSYISLGSYSPGADDAFLVKLGVLTGTEELEEADGLIVSPNPSSGIFNVQSKESAVMSITVFDVLGNKKLIAERSQIDLTVMPAGIYFLQIETAKGIARRKVIKE